MVNYYLFENLEVLVSAIGVLLFVVIFSVFSRIVPNKGISIIVSFAISAIAARYLYLNGFFGGQVTIAILLYLVVAVILLKIMWAFVKGIRRRSFIR